MSYTYPLLNKISRHYIKIAPDVSSIKIYSCQHLLSPQYEMYKRLLSFGFSPENITVLGKIYSFNTEIAKSLQNIGIRVLQPHFSGKAFDTEHAENCRTIATETPRDIGVVVLDDGGFLLKAFQKHSVLFGVEQTSSGFRMLEKTNLVFPIFNVARSKTKLTQESLLVARHSFNRIYEYIHKAGILKPRVLVIGLGPIGKAAYQVFEDMGISTTGCDSEMDKTSLLKYLQKKKPDLVIGATGSQLFNVSDLDFLERKHKYHFISVSSSDREFPVAKLRKKESVHDDVIYKNFIFVNNGFPITFKGNKEELTPIEIEKTIGLLIGSVFHGATHKMFEEKGFIDVPRELEELINS